MDSDLLLRLGADLRGRHSCREEPTGAAALTDAWRKEFPRRSAMLEELRKAKL